MFAKLTSSARLEASLLSSFCLGREGSNMIGFPFKVTGPKCIIYGNDTNIVVFNKQYINHDFTANNLRSKKLSF